MPLTILSSFNFIRQANMGTCRCCLALPARKAEAFTDLHQRHVVSAQRVPAPELRGAVPAASSCSLERSLLAWKALLRLASSPLLGQPLPRKPSLASMMLSGVHAHSLRGLCSSYARHYHGVDLF